MEIQNNGKSIIECLLANMVFIFSSDIVNVNVDIKEIVDVQVSVNNRNEYSKILISDKFKIN